MSASERQFPLEILEAGPIRGPARDIVLGWAARFEPLDFEAGRKAKTWLETNLAAEVLPLRTYFAFNDKDESELYGFFVLDQIEVKVAAGDLPIMQVRDAIDDPGAERHPATKLVWIVRRRRRVGEPLAFGGEGRSDLQLSLASFNRFVRAGRPCRAWRRPGGAGLSPTG